MNQIIYCANDKTPIKMMKKYGDVKVISYILPNGDCHREDGPAYMAYYPNNHTQYEWRINGKLHRYGGPSIYMNGSHCDYWVDGRRVSEAVKEWLSERGYVWETMSEQEKWELDLFMRTL